MANLGFPYAEVDSDGAATLAKVEGTGGCITLATAKEQLLYEVTDPCAYLTPDVSADFDDHLATGGQGSREGRRRRADRRPEQLKVSVGYMAGFVGEGEIGYAGPNASARGELAATTLKVGSRGASRSCESTSSAARPSTEGHSIRRPPRTKSGCGWRAARGPPKTPRSSEMKWRRSTPMDLPVAAVHGATFTSRSALCRP